MERSIFLKTIIASIAAFFSFRKVQENPWTSDATPHVLYPIEKSAYDLPFDGDGIKAFNVAVNGKLITNGDFYSDGKYVTVYRNDNTNTRIKEYKYDEESNTYQFIRYLDIK